MHGGSDCNSFLSLKARSSCFSCAPLVSNNCSLEDVVSPGGAVQNGMFPGSWVGTKGSQRRPEGVFEALSLTTMWALSC